MGSQNILFSSDYTRNKNCSGTQTTRLIHYNVRKLIYALVSHTTYLPLSSRVEKQVLIQFSAVVNKIYLFVSIASEYLIVNKQ